MTKKTKYRFMTSSSTAVRLGVPWKMQISAQSALFFFTASQKNELTPQDRREQLHKKSEQEWGEDTTDNTSKQGISESRSFQKVQPAEPRDGGEGTDRGQGTDECHGECPEDDQTTGESVRHTHPDSSFVRVKRQIPPDDIFGCLFDISFGHSIRSVMSQTLESHVSSNLLAKMDKRRAEGRVVIFVCSGRDDIVSKLLTTAFESFSTEGNLLSCPLDFVDLLPDS